MKYLHFTDLEGAKAIKASGHIKKAGPPFANAVFAIAVGGAYVPSVQQTKLGRAKNRLIALLFTTPLLPDVAFPEEVMWHLDKLPIDIEKVMPAKFAAEKYLDDSIPRDPDTEVLKIPLHPFTMDDEGNKIRD